jgi:hypothetical protein
MNARVDPLVGRKGMTELKAEEEKTAPSAAAKKSNKRHYTFK